MQELTPVYLYPEFDPKKQLNTEIHAEDVEKALAKHPDIQAVVIVSPTYDGVVSDVKAIAEVAHKNGIPLIVDEAHGAHFGFHPYFPESAVKLGADLVIHSVHKTMPSLTQTALLHVGGSLVDSKKVQKYLHMLQSSSPSYVLMASIDNCMQLIEDQGEDLFARYASNLELLRQSLHSLKHLELIETAHYDKSKIVISTRNASITSQELYRKLLEQYHLQMEMVAGTYIVAMTSIADTKEGFSRLDQALHAIDDRLEHQTDEHARHINQLLGRPFPHPEMVYTSYEMDCQSQQVEQDMKSTYVATEYSYLYPPGIPLVVPGERITNEILELQKAYEQAGFSVEHG